MNKLIIISLVIFFTICSRSWAEDPDYPIGRSFVSFGDKDHQMSITYNCSKNENNIVECEFDRKIVNVLSTKTDEEIITGAKETWDRIKEGENEELSKHEIESCNTANQIISYIEDNKEFVDEDLIKHFKYFSDVHKKDYLNIEKNIKDYCDKNIKPYENFLNMELIVNDINRRTCKISNEKYVKTFNKKSEHWLSVSEPVSWGCGTMVVYRFERNADDNYHWDLYLKDIVTIPKGNPNSDVFTEEYCSNKDQEEIMFTWNYGKLPVSCDYVEFGW